LFIWIFTIIFAYFISDRTTSLMQKLAVFTDGDLERLQVIAFYVVGLLAGSVLGATQSTSRSLMSKLTPAEKKTEFFGFYSLFGKSSAIVGPLVFGIVSYLTESQRIAILTVGIFFIIGLLVLSFVEDEKVPDSN
ncbi:MFS transporter, partial [Bacteroidota bacterium]